MPRLETHRDARRAEKLGGRKVFISDERGESTFSATRFCITVPASARRRLSRPSRRRRRPYHPERRKTMSTYKSAKEV